MNTELSQVIVIAAIGRPEDADALGKAVVAAANAIRPLVQVGVRLEVPAPAVEPAPGE